MSDRHYVGLDLTGFQDNGLTRPISRVTLMVDNDNAITSGDDTGLEITANCPHATQEMADAILARMKGYKYQMFSADEANIDPAAELGDGVTAGGVYGVVSRLADDGTGYPGITAPGEAELEDEFPAAGPMTQEFNRQLAQTRSLITKSSAEIRLAIEATDGRVSELKVTLDGVTIQDESGATRIKGSSIDTGSIAAGSIRADQVQLTGAISWGDLDSTAQGQVTSAQSAAQSAQSAASRAETTASNANSNASTALNRVNSVVTYDYAGRTYIDGNKIMTGTVTASKLQGGSVELLDGSANSVGTMTITRTMSGGYGIELSADYGGILISSATNFWFSGSDCHFGSSGGRLNAKGTIVPNTTDTHSLGTSAFRWNNVYAATGQIQTSDRNLKSDIQDIPDRYLEMLAHLRPVIYKLIDGTSGRYHVGFIAQEVEEAMLAAGMDSLEFGGFVKDTGPEGQPIYMLRYEEFIALLLENARRMEKRMNSLEDRISRLEESAA